MMAMLLGIIAVAATTIFALALLAVPLRFPRVGFVGAMVWIALAGAVYFENAHNPDPWAHIVDDVQHAIGIAVLAYAALWIVMSIAGLLRQRCVSVAAIGI